MAGSFKQRKKTTEANAIPESLLHSQLIQENNELKEKMQRNEEEHQMVCVVVCKIPSICIFIIFPKILIGYIHRSRRHFEKFLKEVNPHCIDLVACFIS